MSKEKEENLEATQVADDQQLPTKVDLSEFLEEELEEENLDDAKVESGNDVQMSGIDIAGMGVDLGTAYLVARKGEHWAMTPQERSKLSEIINALAVKYGSSGTVSPEVALIVFGATFAAPRILQDMAIASSEKQQPVSGGNDVGDISTHAD